jgi:hypothetical protein
VVDQDVRANDVFDRIQNLGVVHQPVGSVEAERTL